MTTFTNFAPTPNAPFSFQPTLDGQVYIATVPWLTFGQRWYLNLTDVSGNSIAFLPVIGSATGTNIESISWDQNSQTVTVVTAEAHGWNPYTTATLTVSGVSPTAFNGTFSCFVVDDVTLTYLLASDPGMMTQSGTISYDINILGGYFQTSTMVFRQASQQFEVSP